MKRLVAFELEDKTTIVVETDEPESGMTTRGFQHPQELVENASLYLELDRCHEYLHSHAISRS